MENKLLKDKVAIIVGGSEGIGGATAELFAKEGAKVVITARRQGPLDAMVEKIKSEGGEAIGISTDCSDPSLCQAVFDKTLEVYGDIDILVYNAGVSYQYAIDTTTDEAWDTSLAVNLTGAFHYNKLAINYMLEKNKGCIVNISSMNGIRAIGGVAYSTTKAALNAMTQSVAMRCTGTNVRCNCVCPGGTFTPMAERTGADVQAGINHDPFIMQLMARRVDGQAPWTQAMDQAKAILFMASDLAGAINGCILPVDNGCYL